MTDFLTYCLASAFGYFLCLQVQSFLFVKFKADKYEDKLAEKIADKLKERTGG